MPGLAGQTRTLPGECQIAVDGEVAPGSLADAGVDPWPCVIPVKRKNEDYAGKHGRKQSRCAPQHYFFCERHKNQI